MDSKRGDSVPVAANYFLANSTKLTKLDDTLPESDIDQEKIVPSHNHPQEKRDLINNLDGQLFPKVFTLLLKGYNVVLYGLGSKFHLLEKFIREELFNYTVIVFYGYKEVTQRQILSAFAEVLDYDKSDEDEIIGKLNKQKRPIFLIIHSFDRLFIRNGRIKTLINRILTTPSRQVHLLTTVDHLNSSVIWTCKEGNTLNLTWINCPTFEDYSIEESFAHLSTSRSSGSAKQRSAAATLMAVSNVFGNLPTNSQNIFLAILNYYQTHYAAGEAAQQAKTTGRSNKKVTNDEDTESDSDEDEDEKKAVSGGKPNKGFEGYSFNQLYLDCMDAFLVNSEATLRTQLVEFIDHKLLRLRTGNDGSEFVELLIQPKLIPKVLQELRL